MTADPSPSDGPADGPPAPVFPPDLYYLVEHQTWARFDREGCATVGITAAGILQSGEIFLCRPKPPGSIVGRARAIAVVELAKAILSVRSPVEGVVVDVNPRLEATPALVHLDPYGEGWIARLRVDDPAAEQARLCHGDAVADAMRAALAQADDDATPPLNSP